MRIQVNLSRAKRCLGLLAPAVICSFQLASAVADDTTLVDIYDEAAYAEYVETTMKQLDKLYLDFCDTCGVEGSKAAHS